jgi:hypothetical protein
VDEEQQVAVAVLDEAGVEDRRLAGADADVVVADEDAQRFPQRALPGGAGGAQVAAAQGTGDRVLDGLERVKELGGAEAELAPGVVLAVGDGVCALRVRQCS